MSPAKTRPGGGSSSARRAARSAERIATQYEAKRAAADRRRKQLSIAGAAVAVLVIIGLVVGLSIAFGGDDKADKAGTKPDAPAWIKLPPGADPTLAKRPVVAMPDKAPTKLGVLDLVKGTGAEVKVGQTITVNYVGISFTTKQEFDSSWSKSQTLPTVIGKGAVIQGWDQGLVGKKVGSRVQLDIPTELAYPNPQEGQPAGPLLFVVDILGAQ